MRSFIPFLLIITSVALFYLHIDPRYHDVKLLLEEKSQYKDALKKAQELQSVRDELLTKYNSLPKEDLAKLERLLPKNLNTVKLVADLSAIAGPYGIALHDINVKDSVIDNAQEVSTGAKRKAYQSTSISFRFGAKYEDLILFLKDIEKSLQLVDVKLVDFAVTDDEKTQYDYGVTIVTYWVK